MKIASKSLAALLSGVALSLVTCTAAAYPTTGDLNDLTKWHTNFALSKAYAEEHHIPMVYIWSSAGCSICTKLEKALTQNEDALAWQRNAGYMLLVVKDVEGEAKNFAANPSRDWPYVCVYWLKEDGTTITRKFTGKNHKMLSNEGDTLQEQFMNSVSLALTGTVPSGGSTKPAIPSYWNRARKLMCAVAGAGEALSGTAEVKLGKANSTKGTAKVTATVEFLAGGKKKFSGTVSVSQEQIVLTSGSNTLTLVVDAGGVEGSLVFGGVAYEVQSVTFGGTFYSGDLYVHFDSIPAQYRKASATYPVMTEWFPANFRIPVIGNKWTVPRKGVVKWDRNKKAFVSSNPANSAGVKLTYSSKTGEFKGSYVTYVKTGETKLKKVTTKVYGIVLNYTGYGVATAKGLDLTFLTIDSNPIEDQ